MSDGRCTMPGCEEPVVDGRAQGGLCAEHAPVRDDDIADSTNTTGGSAEKDHPPASDPKGLDVETASHYADARDALEAVGTLDEAGAIQALGNHDFIGWYQSRAETRPEALREGFDRRGRVYGLADDYDALSDELDRVLYATTNYQHRDELHWQPFARGENGKDWMGDDKPTPGYSDLAAYAPFADIDLADEHKERPLPSEKRETVERALNEYVEEFADLAGDREAVYALDSVGGAYLFIAPASTAPIAERFEGDDRSRLFKELVSRMNDWLDDTRALVNQRVPEAEGLFEPDLLNNANRLYKAPLSLHSSIDGVVHPLELDTNTPEYEFVSFGSVDKTLFEDTREWGEAFTDTTHASRISALVASLWPEYADTADGWADALDSWLDDERERERKREIQRAALEQRRDERESELGDLDVTAHFEDVLDAVGTIDVQDVARGVAAEWDTDPGREPPRFAPSWRTSSSGTSCFADEDGFTDLKEGGNGGNAVTLIARARGLITHCSQRVTGEVFWQAVDELRSRGHEIPAHVPAVGSTDANGEEYKQTPYWGLVKAAVALEVCGENDLIEREGDDGSTYTGLPRDGGETFNATLDALDEVGIDTGREHIDIGISADSRRYTPETCAPPAYDPETFEQEQYYEHLRGERYEAFLNTTGPHVWGDPAGSGKSTNAELAAAERSQGYFGAFDKHAKAREAITDPVTPDDQFHIKGGEQPVHECCMDAQVAAEEGETPMCPKHGHIADWERMCPIYQRPKDDDLRQRYEALVGAVGALGAHLQLGLFDEDGHLWHGGQCRWAEQFDELLDEDGNPIAERVAGVHEYQLLKSATEGREVIVDESPRTLTSEQRVTVEKLAHARVRLEGLADIHNSDPDSNLGADLRALAEFTDDLMGAIAGGDPTTLADLDAPDIQPVMFDRPVDPDDLPTGVESEDVERTVWRDYQGINNEHYTEHERTTAHIEDYAETLAKVKLAYNEGLVRQYRDEGTDLPTATFCVDAILAAAAKAGIESADVQRAIAVPPTLENCPWCGSSLGDENGARICSDDDCGWSERENSITQQDGRQARASAWADDDPDDLRGEYRPALVYGELPASDDLPDDPLVLDATATPEKVAGLYGTPLAEVEITGDDPLALGEKLNVTQVIDGQYHAQTIKDTDSLQERVQSVIDTASELHERPLFGIRRDLIPLFEFPGQEGEDYELLVYGGARGLNRAECDAVVCIGAPHPDMKEIQRTAELLAMDHNDLRPGGREFSTRRNAPNPPVYRKLRYADENGDGLAVPTKAYSGVAGALFREAHNKEIEQFVHRIRPLLVEDGEPTKNAYLLTNVPTGLPVNDVVEFEELAGDLSAVFPVTESALRLLGHARDVLAGDKPDGFRAETLVENRDDSTLANKVSGWHQLAQLHGEDVTQRAVRNWVAELEAVGLLTPEKYEQHAGVSYTADFSTSKRALQVLSGNGGFEVAAVRRFVAKVRGSNGSLDWLAWAESVFDLSGDRCGWDPPPGRAG